MQSYCSNLLKAGFEGVLASHVQPLGKAVKKFFSDILLFILFTSGVSLQYVKNYKNQKDITN